MIIANNKNKLKNIQSGNHFFFSYIKKHYMLYTMLLPGFVLILLFNYFPMYGIVMAFQNFKPTLGFFGSPFVGLKYFQRLFSDVYFYRIFKNTVLLGTYTILYTFPAPIILALFFNEIKHLAYKRVIQTISYMPHFLSTVIVIGILRDMLSINDGPVNALIVALGGKHIDFFGSSGWFRSLYVGSQVWQGVGFGTIIYLAAIAGINPEIYEAAVIDGANRYQQAIHITLPNIANTIVILFIFSAASVIGNDTQKILLMYSPVTYSTADVIGTYIYRSGIEGANQSYSAAAGLFMSVMALAITIITNALARRYSEISIW